ncbi:MAG: hypothetical protein ACOYON_09290 [Fimbriimonas sp.]
MLIDRESRVLATVAHGLGLLVPVLGPMLIYVNVRKAAPSSPGKRFVAVHSMHSVIVSAFLNVTLILGITVAMYRMLDEIAVQEPELLENTEPTALLTMLITHFHAGIIIFGLYTFLHILSTLVHGYLAYHGSSVEDDWVGKIAVKYARLGAKIPTFEA